MTLPHRPKFSPAALAELLGLPVPTPEQQAVITAPLGPAAVVAGAGSGKTETMSARVVWLVANGYVNAERVLGLTFTTKAAAELAARIRTRLAALRARVPEVAGFAAGEPVVLTYHAYAGQLVGEHALRIAVEPTARLLTQAMTWQFAEKVVHAYEGDLPHLDNAEATVVGWVLDLAGELAEHLRATGELRVWTSWFTNVASGLPRGKDLPGQPYAKVKQALNSCAARVDLLPLVERYEKAKRDSGAMDFGDQMSLAARIAERCPEVGRMERARFHAVLLDEYQDTGHGQLVLMRSLFGQGHAVTAVGDPCQSIYGWRGASAGNLTRFAEQFPDRSGNRAPVLPLGTSFRNDRAILDVANRLSAPLRAQGIDVGVLSPGPAGGPGDVRCAMLRTADDEADWIASHIDEVWQADAADRAAGKPGRTIAVLARRRSQFLRLERALASRGIPVELVGLGGLLATPEVRDVVSTLRVLSDPTAGNALMRLLTGPRWRIGPRDLMALGRRARDLVRTEDGEEQNADEGSIVEALDDLGPPERYSPEGYQRLDALRRELAGLRRRTAGPLTDLVGDVERVLRLDIELAAHAEHRRTHLDRFLEVAAQFAEDAEVATLGAFLAYLAAAEAQERGLEAGVVQVDDDRVQILTVHAAKGLEWDVVAVPGLCGGVFPDRDALSGSGWLTSVGTLPYPLRGDAADLPDFVPEAADDQKQLDTLRQDFVDRCRARGELEERRLAYVAVTRARTLLLCSGFWWDEAIRPRGPSAFLEDVRAQVGASELDPWEGRPADGEPNPVLENPPTASWPVDPLGGRRRAVAAGADLVLAALHTEPAPPQSGQGQLFDPNSEAWQREIDLLLTERDARLAGGPVDVALPGHLSVSALVALRRDPADLARQIRRPVPFRPAPLARRGTAFHAWLEQRFAGERLLDLDELPGAADEDHGPDEDLELLQERFLASEWAQRRPAEVEVPFEALVGGVLIRGRMDAVFRDPDGRWDVIDWKTGGKPRGAAMRAAAVQLAAYRLAWAELAGIDVAQVRAGFHYVRGNETVRPSDLLDQAGLHALLDALPRQ